MSYDDLPCFGADLSSEIPEPSSLQFVLQVLRLFVERRAAQLRYTVAWLDDGNQLLVRTDNRQAAEQLFAELDATINRLLAAMSLR